MAGEPLGLAVVWALAFVFPIVVVWTVVRVVVAARETLETRRAARRVPTDRGDAHEPGPALPETEPDTDAFDPELDDVGATTDSKSRGQA